MTPKHTRAPWKQQVLHNREISIYTPGNSKPIAIVGTQNAWDDAEQQANADLIAAAPKLLAAAIALFNDAIDREECHNEYTDEMHDDWKALVEAIGEALDMTIPTRKENPWT